MVSSWQPPSRAHLSPARHLRKGRTAAPDVQLIALKAAETAVVERVRSCVAATLVFEMRGLRLAG
jgi:hypothetical protein